MILVKNGREVLRFHPAQRQDILIIALAPTRTMKEISTLENGRTTGCGWITVDEKNYYIMPYAKLNNAILNYAELRYAILSYAKLIDSDLRDADLSDASLNRADLTGTDLTGAYLAGVKANSRTICPNGIHYGTSGAWCPF